MATTPPSLGARIRRARERRQLSQEELAKAVGASTRAVGDWENNRRKPRNRFGALEEVLGVRLDGEPEPEPPIPKSLLREIMNTDGLTDGQRQAVIAAIERTLRGDAQPPPAAPGTARRRPAS